ncbi:MAG TPA: RDD family protein, partial [Vicinamibacteria bacterium]
AQGVAVPKGLQAVVLRLLQKDPARRYRSHAALRAALEPYSSRGLSAVELPRRFLAFVLDRLTLGLLDVPLAVLFFAGRGSSMGGVMTLSLLLKFLYFFVTESLWGRTVGKALLGLRVTAVGGFGPSPLQVLVRTAVFLGAFEAGAVVNLLREALAPPTASPPGWLITLQALAGILAVLPLVTMRARNGYAGLHELWSGTRVRLRRSREAVLVPPSRAAAPLPAGAAPGVYGPYLEAGRLWEREGEALLLGRDPALQRQVWIHRYADAARVQAPAELAIHRPGRLRWLQGVRGASGGWDAYEAPAGISLVEWVRARGALGWREMREVLLGLARAVPAARALALDRVWVDAAPGHARVADFAVVDAAPRAAVETLDAASWPRFLHQATLLGLEGRALAPSELVPALPRAAFPEHARPLLSRICGQGEALRASEDVAQELEQLRRRPAEITRRLRFFTLLVPAAAPLTLIGMGLLTRSLINLAPEWVDLLQTETRIEALDKLQGQSGPRVEEKREAIRMLLAAGYQRARQARSMSDTLRFMPTRTRQVLEAAARDYPALTPAQVEAAKQRAGLPDFRIRAGVGVELSVSGDGNTGDHISLPELIRGLLTTWMGIGFAAFAVSPFFGSGLLLYLSGITLQRQDGRPAEGYRRALRAAIAWGPLLLYLTRLRQPLGTIDLVLLGLAAAGALYALARPQRGLPDLLAGTRLVPR